MAITSFSTLKAELLATLGRAPSDFVYQIVTQEINRDLRLLEMEATATATEAATVALPSDFSAMVNVYRDTTPRAVLTPTTAAAVSNEYQETGTPTKYAIANGEMLLNAPGTGEALNLRYSAEQPPLSGSDDTNVVLTEYPDVYVYGSLYHHALTLGDPRAAGWQAAYEGAKARAQVSDNKNRAAGAPLHPTAQGVTP